MLYALDEGPDTATLTLAGTLRWNVPADALPGAYPVQVTATDNGTPPRNATVRVNLVVPGEPVIVIDADAPRILAVRGGAGEVNFAIGTAPGRSYRVYYKDDLDQGAWNIFRPDFVAAHSTATLSDTVLQGRRFYLVERLD